MENASIFMPRGLGIYATRFSDLLRKLEGQPQSRIPTLLSDAAQEIGDVTDSLGAGFRVSVLILRDYVSSGYLLDIRNGQCRLINPADLAEDSPTLASAALRSQYQNLRNSAMASGQAEPAVSAISRYLAYEQGYDANRVIELLAHGPPEIELRALGGGQSPSRDLYRVVRATWSMAPDRSAPGREESFVAVDKRYPETPLGIMQFRNIVPEIRARDLWVGIANDPQNPHLGIGRFLIGAAGDARIESALLTLGRLLSNVRPEGLPESPEAPSDPLEFSRQAEAERVSARAAGLEARRMGDKTKQMHFLAIEKRCETASALSRGIFGLRKLRESNDITQTLANDQELRRHIEVGLRKVWHYHMGFAFIELSICGAAPPFGPFRIGKLMSLLALSTEALGKWGCDRPLGDIARTVYLERVRDVVPNPGPIALFTSGLYPGHSAQYNRARIGSLGWKHIGSTSGYGSSHISVEATSAIDVFNNLSDGYTHISRTFGEGSGARFRSVGRAINRLGLPDLRKHNTYQPLYAAPLVPDVLGTLLGWSQTRWETPGVQDIADTWWHERVEQRATELAQRAAAESDLPTTLATMLRVAGKQIPAAQGTLT